MQTDRSLRKFGSVPGRDKVFNPSPKHPVVLWGPLSGYQANFARKCSGRSVNVFKKWTGKTIPLRTTYRPILILLYWSTDSRILADCELALITIFNAFFSLQCHFYQVDHHQVPKLTAQIVLINPRII